MPGVASTSGRRPPSSRAATRSSLCDLERAALFQSSRWEQQQTWSHSIMGRVHGARKPAALCLTSVTEVPIINRQFQSAPQLRPYDD
jgi:hypothetical protein